jgi:mono/diheme cytochrome c family protein
VSRRRPLAALGPAALAAALAAVSALWAAACGPPQDRTAKELYPEYCARCHGADGKGDPRNVNLYPALNLTQSKLVGRDARFMIYRRIAQGYGPMPGFAHRLSPVEIGRLTDYTTKLGPAAARRK